MSVIADNLEQVQVRMAAACARCGRDVSTVNLLAVSKTQPPSAVNEAYAAGQRMFGENRVQEAEKKRFLCSDRIAWHLIGHLQTNKLKKAVRLFDAVHSVDSARLGDMLEEACAEAGRRLAVFIEVNVAGEASKFGLAPESVPEVVAAAGRWNHLDLRGLMAIPPATPEPEKARNYFRTLRNLRDRLSAEYGMPLADLSMGMSHDFEVAIEEGATWIRVGSDIFGDREK